MESQLRDKRRKYIDTEEFGKITPKELSNLMLEKAKNKALKKRIERGFKNEV